MVLEGLAIVLANIDPIIQLIKASTGLAEAKQALVAGVWQMSSISVILERAGTAASRPDGLEDHYGEQPDGYHLSPVQAGAILDLRLHRLTSLEQDKIVDELAATLVRIDELLEILGKPDTFD